MRSANFDQLTGSLTSNTKGVKGFFFQFGIRCREQVLL